MASGWPAAAPGNSGSNTAADHKLVLEMALAALPAAWRPARWRPQSLGGNGPYPPKRSVLVRTAASGATHEFAYAARMAGARFSLGFTVNDRIRDAVDGSDRKGWRPAVDTDGSIRPGAWIVEVIATAADLTAWTKLLAFTDVPAVAKAEIAGFRYKILHIAARIARTGRRVHLRIDATWQWARAIATGWQRLRHAFP